MSWIDGRLPRRLGGLGAILAVLIAIVGVAVSLVGARIATTTVAERANETMDRRAEAVHTAVAAEAQRYIDELTTLSAAMGAQSDMSYDDFFAITENVPSLRLSGVTSVSFAVQATNAQMPAVQAYWRERGASGLTLQPTTASTVHRFIVLSRSLDGATPVLGREASATQTIEAMDEARQTGRVSASRTYVLTRDKLLPTGQQQLSFVLVAPVSAGGSTADAGAFRGWLTMAMRGRSFIEQTLRSVTQGTCNVTLTDGVSTSQNTVVATLNSGPPLADRPQFVRTVNVDVADRIWTLRITPTTALLSASEANVGWGIGLGGVCITLLLAALVWILATSRTRAVIKIEEATAQLRKDIARRHAVEASLRDREAELEAFAAVAAHDLKSPLAVVANYADLVQTHLEPTPDPRIPSWLDRLQESADWMRSLIDGLLAYARSRDARIALREVDLNTILTEVVNQRTGHLEEADKPVIRVDRLPVVTADPALIRQVFDNLIGNACKYVRRGATPDIRVSASRYGDTWQVTVADRGIGIPDGQHDQIFGAFTRARGAEAYAGTGLGLAICQRIVTRHGGDIRVEDNPGGGSRFTVVLPIDTDADAPDDHSGDGGEGTATGVEAPRPAAAPYPDTDPERFVDWMLGGR